MNPKYGLIEMILNGEKKVESRWYLSRKAPWDRIKKGDTVFLKYSGKPVEAKAEVRKVLQFEYLKPKNVREILRDYGDKGKIFIQNKKYAYEHYKYKKFCILVFLANPKKVRRFNIDKTGFGIGSAWIITSRIAKIKRGL